jgi:Ca2+-binding RTX toxin-like protein
VAWTINVKYDDSGNFLTNKSLFSGAIQSVANYLGHFIQGTGSLDLTVHVEKTGTGRFAGNGDIYFDHSASGLNVYGPEAARELASGKDQNNGNADLNIYVDPGSAYFSGLNFTTAQYTTPRTVPSSETDGMSVLLHEILHGFGIVGYRDFASGIFISGSARTMFDMYSKQVGEKYLLDAPSFAMHGINPIELTSTSATQNFYHFANNSDLTLGYRDDVMNGLAFYLGHRYFLSQVDLYLLKDLGYSIANPDALPVSYADVSGRGQVTPVLNGGAYLPVATTNALTLNGKSAPGATTSIIEHGTVIGAAVAGYDGSWSINVVLDPSISASVLTARDGTHVIDSAPLPTSRSITADTRLYASDLYRTLVGGSGNDVLIAGKGDNTIDGGAGKDTAVYAGNANSYLIQKTGGAIGVAAKAGDGGNDTLTSVERVEFADKGIAFDVDGNAGQAYRLYQAAFNRTPDFAGLGWQIKAMDAGTPLLQIAQAFVDSAEFEGLYGADITNGTLVTQLYRNVLHRDPEKAGYDFWLNILDTHLQTQYEVLKNFSESAENQAQVIGLIQNGIEYQLFS